MIKTCFDLHCLRRLDFDDDGVRFFLKHSMGDDYPRIWWWSLKFWERGGFMLS